MRTLVISDLHLGSTLQRDVLRRPAALGALLGALRGIDRLVLLGDTVELLEGRSREAMAAAEPVLRRIGAELGPGIEVVMVPGNHDHSLVRPWLRARAHAGRPLGLSTRVPLTASGALRRMGEWLRGGRGRGPRLHVHYPGVWLAPRVWAHHGHYLDRHLSPAQWGTRRVLGEIPRRGATAWHYERATGTSLAAMQGVVATALPRLIGAPIDLGAGLARRGATAALPVATAVLGEERVAPMTASLLGLQFRRAGLPSMATVAERLHIRADHVLFGHLHRPGRRADDDPAEWTPPDGTRTLWNSGSWVYEPLLLAGAQAPHPYWPGGALLLRDDREPEVLSLLDGVSARALRP